MRVFLRAVQLYEAQGAILVTRVDSGDGDSIAASHIIHVNPAWFADLVRRVVDIRLLESAQQEKVREALKAFATLDSVDELYEQHVEFLQGGEVSRKYLKLIWVRDMKLGAASHAAPPLQMPEEEDTSTQWWGFCSTSCSWFEWATNTVVLCQTAMLSPASCLPAYAGSELDPEKKVAWTGDLGCHLVDCRLGNRRDSFSTSGAYPAVVGVVWPGQRAHHRLLETRMDAALPSRTTWCCCTRVAMIQGLLQSNAMRWGVHTTRKRREFWGPRKRRGVRPFLGHGLCRETFACDRFLRVRSYYLFCLRGVFPASKRTTSSGRFAVASALALPVCVFGIFCY